MPFTRSPTVLYTIASFSRSLGDLYIVSLVQLTWLKLGEEERSVGGVWCDNVGRRNNCLKQSVENVEVKSRLKDDE